MEKELNQVRKSIIQRNKMRNLGSSRPSERSVIPTFPQEEEKHGYLPSFLDPSPGNKNEGKIAYNMMMKAIMSAILFLGIALLLQSNATFFAKPKEWTNHVLTEEFPFARVNLWYQQTFGTPLAFNPQKNNRLSEPETMALPVNGSVTETFQVNGSGIMISPKESSPVSAWREGMVIFAGNDREMDKTVIIQHADSSKSTYALLSSIDVHLYQFVQANQRIGTFNPTEISEMVYFSIEKDNRYMDPIQVIQVDDLP